MNLTFYVQTVNFAYGDKHKADLLVQQCCSKPFKN